MPSTGLGVYASAFLEAALAAGFRADAFLTPAFFATGFFAVFLATFFFAMRGSLPQRSRFGQFTIVLGQVASQTRHEGASNARRTWVFVERRWRPRTKYGEANWPSTLHGPRFLAPAHIPKHPLVAAGGDEVAAHELALARAQSPRHLIEAGDDEADEPAELLGSVGADPSRVERVLRARALEGLADLPVDPVAGQERRHRLVKWRAVCRGEQIARVGLIGRGQGGGRHRFRREPPLGEEALVERPLHLESAGRVLVEHDDPLVPRRAGGRDGEG